MRVVALGAEDDFEGWRDAVRALVAARVPPDEVAWQVGEAAADLFGGEVFAAPSDAPPFRVSRRFVDLARNVVLHAHPARFGLLHAMLARLVADPGLIEDMADPMRRRLEAMAQAVRRDIHKMRAFLRFRQLADDAGERYVAWFEPEHHIVRYNARFFVDRFNAMRWSILAPEISIHWDGQALHEGPGATRGDAPDGDPVEDVWKAYYASTFNPARLKLGAMLKEMPRRYWKNMPETALVGELVAGARAREVEMIEKARTAPGGNAVAAWEALRDEAAGCTRCPLYKPATQTVFGEGPVDAALMFVGEQPGDQEDLAGRPFVGPAGQVFDRALGEAGIDRASVYVSNAVKHFKFEPRGKRRIHLKPAAGEIEACRWWIDQELALVTPRLVVAMGATAARSMLGRAATISRERGRVHEMADGTRLWITVHPSYLLRITDHGRAEEENARFVDDLRRARELIATH